MLLRRSLKRTARALQTRGFFWGNNGGAGGAGEEKLRLALEAVTAQQAKLNDTVAEMKARQSVRPRGGGGGRQRPG